MLMFGIIDSPRNHATRSGQRQFSYTHVGGGGRRAVSRRQRDPDPGRPGDGDAAAAGLPALGGSGDFQAIRGAEKVLADGEDWRVLGTDADPTVQEALGRTS